MLVEKICLFFEIGVLPTLTTDGRETVYLPAKDNLTVKNTSASTTYNLHLRDDEIYG